MCKSKTIITTTNCGFAVLQACPKVRLSFPILAAAFLRFDSAALRRPRPCFKVIYSAAPDFVFFF
jgi:hypothetical protein